MTLDGCTENWYYVRCNVRVCQNAVHQLLFKACLPNLLARELGSKLRQSGPSQSRYWISRGEERPPKGLV